MSGSPYARLPLTGHPRAHDPEPVPDELLAWPPKLDPSPYGCGYTVPAGAYLMHCVDAHGGPGAPIHLGRPTVHHQGDDCSCCKADAQ